MPFETCLTFKAECEECPATKTVSYYGGEHGILKEEGQERIDFMFDLEFHEGWELERVSYEEHHFYCPNCKARRESQAA